MKTVKIIKASGFAWYGGIIDSVFNVRDSIYECDGKCYYMVDTAAEGILYMKVDDCEEISIPDELFEL